MHKNKIVKLCLTAIFAALYFVLESASVMLTQNVKITFSGLPLLLAAFILGPGLSGVAGGVGCFISQLLKFGFSVTTPLWILPAVVRGLSAGLIYKAFKKRPNVLPISVSAVASSLMVTAANTLAIYVDSKVYGYYSSVLVFGDTVWRFISSVITAVIYSAVSVVIMNALKSEIRKLG